jgi:hypothetical protein
MKVEVSGVIWVCSKVQSAEEVKVGELGHSARIFIVSPHIPKALLRFSGRIYQYHLYPVHY